MQADVRALAAEVDIVAVSFHKGVAFVRAELAQYSDRSPGPRSTPARTS